MLCNPQYIICNDCFKLDSVVGIKKFYVLRKVRESRGTKREEAQAAVSREQAEGSARDALFAIIVTKYLC